MNPLQQKIFSIFQTILLILPAFFLLYLVKVWFWFLVPLPSNVLEYATGFILVYWLIGLWKFHFPRPVFKSKWQAIIPILFLLAVSFATAKIVFHLDKGRATPLGIWKGWFMVPAIYFFMLISSFRTKKDLTKLIEVTIGIISMTAIVMLIQFFTGWISPITSTYDLRLVWPYLDPLSGKGASGNYPALFMAPFFCIAWGMFMQSKKKIDKAFYLISAFAMVLVIYFTKSYGAWLAILGASALTSFFIMGGKKRWIIVPLLTFIVLAGMYWSQKNSEKFQFALDTNEENVIGSGEERLNIWNVALDLIARDPIWGVGPGQFQRAFERQAPFTLGREISRKEINHALHPHNIWLMFWLSNGIFGVISFLLFIGMLFVNIPKEWRWILISPLFYFLFHGMIDVFYWKNDLAFSFWFVAALIVIAQNMNFITGTVEKGIQKGRELGFPTANIKLNILLDKRFGVYSVILKLEKEKKKGLLYYGPRKTKGLPESIVTEISIFDFNEDIYDKKISFQIIKFIRDPMVFPSEELLRNQIKKDILVARHLKLN